MKKTKKFIAVLLTALIMGTFITPAMASPVQDSALREGGMVETVHPDGVIFRTLVRNAPANNDETQNNVAYNYERTKEELKQLGLDGRAVENMDAEALAELAVCPSISSTIIYYQISMTGKRQIVEEDVALAAAERAANPGPQLFGSEFDSNKYVKVVVTSSKTAPVDGQNAYLIHGTFTWLTEPKLGGKEFFGIGSTNCTFASEDASGYVSWRHKKYQNDGTVTSDSTENHPQSPKLKTSKTGDVEGVGYEFSLPITRYSTTTGKKVDEYSEWFGYISAKGVIRSLQEGSFYNSATYLHQAIVTTSQITFQLVFDRNGISPSAIYTASPAKAYVALPVSVRQTK